MVGSVVESPLAHSGSDAVRQLELQGRALLHGVEQSLVGLLVKVATHGGAAEYLLAEVLRGARCRCLNVHGSVVQRRFNHLKS